MLNLDGFGVLDAVGLKLMPFTIFVTAYDAFAIRAFEAHALDYQLKPFADERFEAAFERAGLSSGASAPANSANRWRCCWPKGLASFSNRPS